MNKGLQERSIIERIEDFVFGVYGAFEAVILNHRDAVPVASQRKTVVAAVAAVEEGPVTVLAIDDDEAFLEAVSEMLKEKGWDVLTATSAARGLELLRLSREEIDVVLLDYNMPNLTGDVALEHLRKLRPDMKVIGATGMEVQELPVGFREGVDDILGKPFGSRDLIGCIQAVVHHSAGGFPA